MGGLKIKKAYFTLARSAEIEYIVKRSRFIGYASPVTTPDEALDFLNDIRVKHRTATHNVYAYLIRDNQIQRYSDDGEPQGTAGVPVLDIILKEGLTDCIVVVTRYFGGIMLGAGGLVRAYSHTAKLAVNEASIIKMEPCSVLRVQSDYSFYGKLNNLIEDFGGNVQDLVFEEMVDVTFSLPQDLKEGFDKKLVDLSSGRLSSILLEDRYENLKK